MKKQKLKLDELKITSFVTEEAARIKGGVSTTLVDCKTIASLPIKDCIIVASQNSSCP